MAKSPCTRCSKIRCKLFALVVGLKATLITGSFCGGDGAYCEVRGFGRSSGYGEYPVREFRLGDSGSDFRSFLRMLKNAFVLRIKGKRNEITQYDI